MTGPEKFRVYNRDRDNFLSSEITVANTTTLHLKSLIDDLAVQSDFGLWLKPYRGIPEALGLPPFDLLYLDDNNRVAQEVESYPSPYVKPLKARVASALVLPPRTHFASIARSGDQLEIGPAAKMERLYGMSSTRTGSGRVLSGGAAQVEGLPSRDRSTLFQSDERTRQLQRAVMRLDDEDPEAESKKKGSLVTRFLRWLNQDSLAGKRADRHPLPGLVAYHWTGGAPRAYHIGDISESGVYLLTQERPFIGTMILTTIQRTNSDGESPEDSIAVQTKVVRWGDDGIGLAFVFLSPLDVRRGDTRAENGADQKTMQAFLQRLGLPQK